MNPGPNDLRLARTLLLITCSMGALDAICLLRYGIFTGYMTGTVVLIGVHLAGGPGYIWSGVVALASFFVFAVIGGRLVRRHQAPHRCIGEIFLLAGTLLVVAAAMSAINRLADTLAVVAVLAAATGLQISATRYAALPDMALPALTMVLHGIAYDSHVAGGTGIRSRFRLTIFFALFSGAIVGTLLEQVRVCLGLGFCALLVFIAAFLLIRPTLPRRRESAA